MNELKRKRESKKENREWLLEQYADTLPAQSAKTSVQTHSAEREMKAP